MRQFQKYNVVYILLIYCVLFFFIVAVRCSSLNAPSDGSVSLSGTTVGSTATYSCNDGFRLQGESKRRCQNNGEWSGRAPTCQRKLHVTNPCASIQSLAHLCCSFSIIAVRCRRLNNPSDGSVSLSGTTVGSTATYSCNDGFRLQGESKRRCQNNGEWSGRAPTCQRKLHVTNPCASIQSLTHLCCSFSIIAVRCRRLNNPSDGSVSLSGTTVGSTATYSCNDGFRLQGGSRRRCQNNGEWSGRAPTCQRKLHVTNPCASIQFCSFSIIAVRCRRLNNPSDGSVSISGTTVGSTATYTCNDGFSLQGESKRRCQTNGQWSGRAPTCLRKLNIGTSALMQSVAQLCGATCGLLVSYWYCLG